MIGNDLLEYQLMRAHQERLLAEGGRRRLARAARTMPASSAAGAFRTPVRAAAVRLGGALIAVGNQLQSVGTSVPSRH